jgi:chromosome partitioning protein
MSGVGRVRVVAVSNTKPGTGKTTTVAFLAHAIAAAGVRVLAVDADPAGSLTRWAEAGEWTVPVIGLATNQLHAQLHAHTAGFDVALVDSAPFDQSVSSSSIAYSALRAASDVVVPVAPSGLELDRLGPMLAAIDAVAPLCPDGAPPRLAVLLNRVVANATSTREAREALTAGGCHVLETVIPRWERYVSAFGQIPTLGPLDPYTLAAEEIGDLIAQGRAPVAAGATR